MVAHREDISGGYISMYFGRRMGIYSICYKFDGFFLMKEIGNYLNIQKIMSESRITIPI